MLAWRLRGREVSMSGSASEALNDRPGELPRNGDASYGDAAKFAHQIIDAQAYRSCA